MGNPNPRRRRLPALGVTTVGLAVSAGSLGLYQGASAEPVPVSAPPADQPAWAAAPPPVEPRPDPAVVQTGAVAPPDAPLVLPELPTVGPVVAPPVIAPVVAPPQPTTEWPVQVKPPAVLPSGPTTPAVAGAAEAAPMPRVHTAPAPRTEVQAVPVAASPLRIEPAVVTPPAQSTGSAELARSAPLPHPELSLPPATGSSNFGMTAAPAAMPTLPGDSPMTSPLSAARSAVLGAVLAAGPASAQDSSKSMPSATEVAKKTDETVEALKKKLGEATDKAKALELRVKLLEDELLGTTVKETGSTVFGLRQKFDDMVKKFDALQTKYAALETKVGDAAKSTSAYPPVPGTTTPGATTNPKATVRILNEYGVPITLVLNGVGHRVEPGGFKNVEVPSGTYTYELLNGAAGAAESKPISAGDSVNLRIR